MSELAKVQISIPVHCNISPETTLSLCRLIYALKDRPPPGMASYDIRYWEDSMLPRGRHMLLTFAFREEATHILWLDADMVFPADTVHRLLKHDLPVVGANCVRRRPPHTWTAQKDDGTEVSSYRKTGVEQVGRLGFGITLMKLEVFREIGPPFFNFEWIEDDPETKAGHYMGEDIYLFEKLATVGIRPYIDHELSREIKHIGSIAVDETFSEAWREGSEDRPDGAPEGWVEPKE